MSMSESGEGGLGQLLWRVGETISEVRMCEYEGD